MWRSQIIPRQNIDNETTQKTLLKKVTYSDDKNQGNRHYLSLVGIHRSRHRKYGIIQLVSFKTHCQDLPPLPHPFPLEVSVLLIILFVTPLSYNVILPWLRRNFNREVRFFTITLLCIVRKEQYLCYINPKKKKNSYHR